MREGEGRGGEMRRRTYTHDEEWKIKWRERTVEEESLGGQQMTSSYGDATPDWARLRPMAVSTLYKPMWGTQSGHVSETYDSY